MIKYPSKTDRRVSQNILALMRVRNIKQSDLADALNETRVTINRRLRGKSNWNISKLEQVARLLDVNLSMLIGEGEKR